MQVATTTAAGASQSEKCQPNTGRLRRFVRDISKLIEGKPRENDLLAQAEPLLAALVAVDDWLPASYAQESAASYQQYLLYCDAQERFSVVSFVWGAGQSTPIHDHRTWGLIGMLRGSEIGEPWMRTSDGHLSAGTPRPLLPGETDCVSPRLGDIHRVANASAEQTAISIHLYGANIGRLERSIYTPDGRRKPFVSGYANATLPNLWQL